MSRPEPFVTCDARSEGLARPAWIVTFERAADTAGGLVLVPGDTSHEAIARAASLAIVARFVQDAGELGDVHAQALDCPMREALPLVASILSARGARGVIADEDTIGNAWRAVQDAGDRPVGYIVPPAAQSRRVH